MFTLPSVFSSYTGLLSVLYALQRWERRSHRSLWQLSQWSQLPGRGLPWLWTRGGGSRTWHWNGWREFLQQRRAATKRPWHLSGFPPKSTELSPQKGWQRGAEPWGERSPVVPLLPATLWVSRAHSAKRGWRIKAGVWPLPNWSAGKRSGKMWKRFSSQRCLTFRTSGGGLASCCSPLWIGGVWNG